MAEVMLVDCVWDRVSLLKLLSVTLWLCKFLEASAPLRLGEVFRSAGSVEADTFWGVC